ncbi:hypothetical protein GCM10020000_88050 [Streptomyces olivoverticillatus]
MTGWSSTPSASVCRLGLDRAAPLVLAAARAAVEACCKLTRPRFPGDWSSVTENTATACLKCRAWLGRTA